ncbi:hypothetical protein BKA81DRAFT_52258 [Phyllosticta paracitricarpa]
MKQSPQDGKDGETRHNKIRQRVKGPAMGPHHIMRDKTRGCGCGCGGSAFLGSSACLSATMTPTARCIFALYQRQTLRRRPLQPSPERDHAGLPACSADDGIAEEHGVRLSTTSRWTDRPLTRLSCRYMYFKGERGQCSKGRSEGAQSRGLTGLPEQRHIEVQHGLPVPVAQ